MNVEEAEKEYAVRQCTALKTKNKCKLSKSTCTNDKLDDTILYMQVSTF